MRILMVGAGAVGTVLTRAIEKTKGHDVTYYVRAGRKKLLSRVKLLDAKSGELYVRERPAVIEPQDPLPVFDTAILAVRADQLDEALDVVARLSGEVRIASTSAGFDDLVRIRARFPGRAAVQILPMFMAYPDGTDAIRWWLPPLARTLVTDQGGPGDGATGDEASKQFAEELTQVFVAGGLPARAVRGLGGARDAVFGAGMPILASLELAGWDVGALAHDKGLRTLASRAATEGLRAMSGGVASRLLGFAPSPLVAMLLRVAPAMPKDVQAMWRVHGPKIAGQTREILDRVIARGVARSAETGSLSELRRRLDQA